MTLVAELNITVPFQTTPDKFAVIAIQMNGVGCTSVIFYKVRKTSSDCQMKKTDGEVGQYFPRYQTVAKTYVATRYQLNVTGGVSGASLMAF